MDFFKYTAVIILLFLFSFCYKDQASQILPKKYTLPLNEKALIERSNQIGIYYFNKLLAKKNADENLIISPIGLSLGLNSLISSLRDNSNENIKLYFGYSNIKDSLINDGYKSLFKIFSEIDHNTFFSDIDNFTFSRELSLSSDFLFYLDKNKNVRKAFDQNSGISDEMKDENALKIVNNFDFKARGKFQERMEQLPFYFSPDKSGFLDMVASEAMYNYYGDAAVKAIEMPLGRGNFNILILIPKAEHSIEDITSKVSLRMINKIKNKFEPKHIEVFMPKMHISSRESILNQSTGSSIYQFGQGLKGIVQAQTCYLYDFEQLINFDFIYAQNPELDNFEKTVYQEQDKKELLFVDRPFVFLVYEKYSEAIVLIGRVINP